MAWAWSPVCCFSLRPLLKLQHPELLLQSAQPSRLLGTAAVVLKLWVHDDVLAAPRCAVAPAKANAHATAATCKAGATQVAVLSVLDKLELGVADAAVQEQL